QWIQGIIPTVGGGWDLESLPIDVQGPGGSWFWLPEGDVAYLAPSSVLGTIDTPNGLGLEYGPGTLSDGDPLPGGWWATSDGGGGCANDGNPNTMWGLPASCGSTQEVEFCFDLQVGLLDDIGQCDDEDFTDLKVHIFTMADGQTGCWSNNSCSGDIPVTFNAILDCTSLVFILGDDVEICHDQVLDIPLESEDGSDVDIIVEVFDEGNTSGASDHIFPGGMGVIADQIENDGDEITILYYEVYALDPESICEGPRTLIEVVVYPEIEVEGEDPYYICFQDPMEITPLVSGGNGGPYEYLWEDGSSDASIVLPENPDLFPGEYEIRLLVTDEFGCTKDVAIEYEIIEPLYPEIINPYVGVCKDGILDLPELFLEFESAGTGPYEFQWESNPTGLEFVNGDDSQNLIINEEESSARTYTIFGTIIDDFGCEYSAQTEFIVDNGPDMILEIDECFGTAFNLIGYDRDGLMVTFELFYDDNGDWIYDGTTILNATSVATAFGDNITYLAEEYGTYLLLGTSTNGCTDYVELELPPVPLPQFEVIPNDTICQGTTVTISLLNVDDYVDLDWSNGESTDSIVVTPLDTITYYLVAETNDDCVVTDSIKIVVNPLPDINVTGSTSICPGAQTILTAQGDPANSYLWTGPSGTMITTQTATIAAGGDWNLDVVTPSGCLSSQIISIDVNQQLNPEIDGGNLCTGSVVELNGGPGFDEYEWLDDNNDNVGNTQTIEVSTGGIYTLNVVLGSGMFACSGTDDFEVLQFDPLPNALIQLNTAVCNINTGGLPTFVDLTSFETGVNGSWFDENNIPVSTPDNVDFTGQLPGSLNYTFVTNQAQEPCTEDTYVFTIDVSDCSCPSVAINTPPDFCNEPDTFDLSLIQITTEPGIWSVLPAGMAILNDQLISSDQTPPGVYTLTFTLDDINQPAECSIDSSVTFVVFNELSAELASNVTVCNEDTGNGPDFIDLDDLFISGDPGTWSTNEMGLTIDADNVVSFTSQPLGDYRLFYFMEELNSPCDPVSIPLDITVRDCSCPELALAALPPLCNSGGTYNLETLLTNPENEPGVWSINGPDDSVLIGTSVFSDDRPAGTYELTFTFTNSLGGSCTNSISGDLEIIDPPSAEISEIESACNGTNITVFPTALDFTTFVSGSEGMWTAPLNYNGGFIDDVMAVDFLDVNPGIYVFTYTTTTAIAPCDNVSYTMEVEVRNCNCPSVAFISPTPVCNDGPPVDLNSYIPPNSPEGEWSFVNGTPSVAIANGSIIDISVLNGFYLFQYTLNEVPIGCPEFGQISIEVVTPPIVNHIPNVEVCNEVSINGPNCIDLTTYLTGAPGDWTIPSNYDGDASDLGNICFDSDDVGEVLEFVFNTATGSVTCDERAYTTEVIIKDCSCPNLSIIPPNSLCNLNGNLDLSSLETSDIEPGTWSVVNGPTAISLSGNILSLNGEEAGIYTLQYTPNITPSADCDQFSQTTLEVVDYPSVGELAFTQLCIKDGEVVQLDDLLNNQDAGGRWSSVVNTAGFNFADNTFTGDGQEPGMYEFVYAFENIAPCPDNSISVEVIVIPDIETEVENSPCADANDGAIIVASVPSGGGTYLYSIDGGSTWTQNTNFNNLAPGSYTILIEDENGCQSELPNLIISEPGPFSVDTGEDRNIEADIGAVTLELATSVDVSMIANIVWTEDGNVICSGGVDQCLIIEVDPDGIGEYCATVTDLNGCVSEDCVVVRERIVKDVYIPNTFSPFSNDNNNIFYVQADQYVETVNEFLIMDRWGELVFAAEPNHTPNDKEFGWDGTFNGGVVEQGVYVYMVTVTYADGEEELFVGNITALR
ncbi:MAG: hypothetical protein HKO66_02985, partial [Saprospiraceae bacterium]|nr:hypothetical protein [Saprospiraceae bacterium]